MEEKREYLDWLEYSSEEEKEDLYDMLRNMSKKTKKVNILKSFLSNVTYSIRLSVNNVYILQGTFHSILQNFRKKNVVF